MQIKLENIPVPEVHVIAIILSILIKSFFPAQIFSINWIGHSIGWPLLGMGVLIALWATSEAGKMSMASPNRLITTGPYAHSRNPMYVGWTLILIGVLLVLNTLWSLAMLAIVVFYTHFYEILPEERFLQEKFGAQFEQYRKHVRRYF